ncbi:uncharacterized protein LOC130635537 isoform X1 [Hydractinia symbiolongicarpus]|uniref:uncharacterized protein LOC130635537 isoform X1 n=1 Tax=Hydractinia symbiolongicarpus TaxID=13093 RepID=UPI00254C4548|nr:uncharacterized protein LOC130635537 isoform X1 [Hydractinia symbiolongicarpus]
MAGNEQEKGHPCHLCKEFYATEPNLHTCRHRHETSTTPPGFWEIDFPGSPEIRKQKLMFNVNDKLPDAAKPRWIKGKEEEKQRLLNLAKECRNRTDELSTSKTDSSDHTNTDEIMISPPAKKTFYSSELFENTKETSVLVSDSSVSSGPNSSCANSEDKTNVSETTAAVSETTSGASCNFSEDRLLETGADAGSVVSEGIDEFGSTGTVTYDCILQGNTITIIKDASSSTADDTGPDVIIQEISPLHDAFPGPLFNAQKIDPIIKNSPTDSVQRKSFKTEKNNKLANRDCSLRNVKKGSRLKSKTKRSRTSFTRDEVVVLSDDDNDNICDEIVDISSSSSDDDSNKWNKKCQYGIAENKHAEKSFVNTVVPSDIPKRTIGNTAVHPSILNATKVEIIKKLQTNVSATQKGSVNAVSNISAAQSTPLNNVDTVPKDFHSVTNPCVPTCKDSTLSNLLTTSSIANFPMDSSLSSTASESSCVSSIINTPSVSGISLQNKSVSTTNVLSSNITLLKDSRVVTTVPSISGPGDIMSLSSNTLITANANTNNENSKSVEERSNVISSVLSVSSVAKDDEAKLIDNHAKELQSTIKTNVDLPSVLSNNNDLKCEVQENVKTSGLTQKNEKQKNKKPPTKSKDHKLRSNFHFGTASFLSELLSEVTQNKKNVPTVKEHAKREETWKTNNIKNKTISCTNQCTFKGNTENGKHEIINEISKENISMATVQTNNLQPDAQRKLLEEGENKNDHYVNEGKKHDTVEAQHFVMSDLMIDENNDDITSIPKNEQITSDTDVTYQSYAQCSFTETEPKQLALAVNEFNTSHENYLRGCTWSPDGCSILTNSSDNILRLFTIPDDIHKNTDNELIASLRMSEGETVYDMTWYPFMNSADPDTCCFISTSRDHPIHLWDACTGRIRCSYRAFDQMDELASANSIAFNLDGSKIYCGFNNVVRVFDSARPGRDFTEIHTVAKKQPHRKGRNRFALNMNQSGIISSIGFSREYNGLFALGSFSKSIGLYSTSDNKLLHILNADVDGHLGGITQVKFTDDGLYLFSGGRKDTELICWDMRNTTMPLFKLLRAVNTNQRIQFDIDRCGCHVVSGDSNNVINVWDLNDIFDNITDDVISHQPTHQYVAHEDAVNAASLHPTKSLLATTSGQRHFIVDDSDSDSMETDNKTIHNFDNSLRIWSI